jgi:hypothetical protein
MCSCIAHGNCVATVVVVPLEMPLPLLLYLRGGRGYKEGNQVLQHDHNQDSISTCLFYRYSYLRPGEHVMIL